ncbi:MAG: hypothetical protein IJP92_00795 [Lachnospiraceae bacterium]|nr:hypothetical protein [Lachnospiraceae bacterium]
MSFIDGQKNVMYQPGYFLAREECTRETRQMPQAGAQTAANGGKYVPMGTIFPADDATAIGIVYEDVDVSSGDMPGSVVTAGTVYENRLTISSAAKTALEGLGFKFVADPAVTRP